ncbi:MAG TPA: hypothetical protein EYN66_14590, partial [Myxococcales bacterium]|nr:hypothetical protein [Myxococcales bacterium]
MSRHIIAICTMLLLAACGTDEQAAHTADLLEDTTGNDLGFPPRELPFPNDSAEEETTLLDTREAKEVDTVSDTRPSEDIVSPDAKDTSDPPDTQTGKCSDNPVVVLQVYPLDIWAQLLKVSTITFADIDSGQELLQVDSTAISIPMCAAAQYKVTVAAPNHDSLEVVIDFDGSDAPDAITMTTPGKKVAHVFTRTFKNFISVPNVLHFTLWTGLPHHWFAPGASPARHGNHLTLLSSGEDAWAAVASELSVATEQVLVASWWWSSYFEI